MFKFVKTWLRRRKKRVAYIGRRDLLWKTMREFVWRTSPKAEVFFFDVNEVCSMERFRGMEFDFVLLGEVPQSLVSSWVVPAIADRDGTYSFV